MEPGREKNLGVQGPKDGLTLAWTPGCREMRIEEPLRLAGLRWRDAYSLVRSNFSM